VNWKYAIPYLLPLLVLYMMYRRSGRTRKVRVTRMAIRPVVILLLTGSALYASGFPTFLWLAAYVLAAAAGCVVGYLNARHTHLAVNPETSQVESTQTPVATAIIMGLFAFKFVINMAFPQLNGGQRPGLASMFQPDAMDAVQAAQQASHTVSTINYATDTVLIFSTGIFVISGLEMWMRSRRLLAEHKGEHAIVTED